MTTQEIVKQLRCCSAKPYSDCDECPNYWCECDQEKLMEMAADQIVSLMAELEQAKRDGDAWKRRAEAAERDMGYMVPCCTCKVRPIGGAQECNACSANILDGLKRSHYTWRGPCKENEGGAAN